MPTNWGLLESELCRFPPKGTASDSGNRTVRKVILPQDQFPDIFLVRKKYLGYAKRNPDGVTLDRWLPWKDPDDPTQFAVSMDHQGFLYKDRSDDDTSEWPFTTAFEPKYWVCTIQFERPLYPVGENYNLSEGAVIGLTPDGVGGNNETTRYCTKKLHQSYELVNPLKGNFYLEGAGPSAPRIPIESPIPTVVPKQHIEVVFHRIPVDAIPYTAIERCIRAVNKGVTWLPAIPDGRTLYDAETLQLEGADTETITMADGNLGVNLHYSFELRSGLDGSYGQDIGTRAAITWNTLPDSLGKSRKVYRSQTGSDRYWPTEDYNALFLPQPP